MIAIVDYGMGNLRSVANAFDVIGASAQIVNHPAELEDAHAIVLPGVGAFAAGMTNLRERCFVRALNQHVRERNKPFLGLCLGMQLLANVGYEHGEHEGLGWISGCVKRFPDNAAEHGYRVPHIGWNTVETTDGNRLYKDTKTNESFYFVHSYALIDVDPEHVSGWSLYGVRFAASVEVGNIFGTQFHPEKSHRAGLSLLKTFAAIARGGSA